LANVIDSINLFKGMMGNSMCPLYSNSLINRLKMNVWAPNVLAPSIINHIFGDWSPRFFGTLVPNFLEFWTTNQKTEYWALKFWSDWSISLVITLPVNQLSPGWSGRNDHPGEWSRWSVISRESDDFTISASVN